MIEERQGRLHLRTMEQRRVGDDDDFDGAGEIALIDCVGDKPAGGAESAKHRRLTVAAEGDVV